MSELMCGILADEKQQQQMIAVLKRPLVQWSITSMDLGSSGASDGDGVATNVEEDAFPLPLPGKFPALCPDFMVKEDVRVPRLPFLRKRKDSYDVEDVGPSSDLSSTQVCRSPRLKQLKNSSREDVLCRTPVKIQRTDSVPSTPPQDFGKVPVPGTPFAARTPKARDRIFMSPPAAPNWMASRNETIDDVNSALTMESLPLLCAAFSRSHACRGKCCGSRDHSLHEAITMEHYDAVAFLLKKLPHESLHEACSGVLPLTRALSVGICNGGNYELAKLLLQHGANPNSKSGPNGETALHAASSCGAINAVKLLLEYGADHDAKSAQKLTPLHAACRTTLMPYSSSKERVVVCLLEHGADPNLLDDSDLQPADYIRQFADLHSMMMLSNKDPLCSGKLMKHVLSAKYAFNRLRLRLARGRANDDNSLQRLPLHLLDSLVHYM